MGKQTKRVWPKSARIYKTRGEPSSSGKSKPSFVVVVVVDLNARLSELPLDKAGRQNEEISLCRFVRG